MALDPKRLTFRAFPGHRNWVARITGMDASGMNRDFLRDNQDGAKKDRAVLISEPGVYEVRTKTYDATFYMAFIKPEDPGNLRLCTISKARAEAIADLLAGGSEDNPIKSAGDFEAARLATKGL